MHTSRSPIAVIFDMDGVIIDSNPWHKIALREFCERHGHHLSDEYLKEHVYGRANKDWIPVLFGDISDTEIRKLSDEKESLFREIFRDHIKPVSGLIPFLDALEENNIPKAIATSAPADNVTFTLRHTKTQKYFNVILDESDITYGKPDPEIYLRTATHIKYPPESCIVIEDSISGVESALRAGCRVIGITTTHPADDFEKTGRVINDFTQLHVEELFDL